MQKRIEYIYSIDLLRGLAALAVAFFHFAVGNSDYLSADNPLKIIGHYGWAGVEVFFVISGLVIPFSLYIKNYRLRSYPRFLLKRIVRLEPPYILSIFLVLALEWLSANVYPYYRGSGFSFDFERFLLHLGYLNVFFHKPWYNPVYWSLAVEFQYYLLMGLLFPLLIYPNWIVRTVVLIIFASSHYVLPDIDFVFYYSILFALGIILFYYFIGELQKWQLWPLVFLMLAWIYLTYSNRIFVLVTLGVLGILLIKHVPQPFRFLGRISYSLYLVHVPIGGRLINVFEQFVQNEFWRSVGVFLALGVSIFSAWIFYKLIEDPSLKLSKRIRY